MATVRSTQPIKDVIGHIVSKNHDIAEFWSRSEHWAPLGAAGLLSKARLDWQISLSYTLLLWVSPSSTIQGPDADGRLILGWANLGSLVEGSLKWFLSVYLENYRADESVIRRKKGRIAEPNELALGEIRIFFRKTIWPGNDEWDTWILRVQQRRNAIHSYQSRDIGTFSDLEEDIRKYYALLLDLNSRVLYPE